MASSAEGGGGFGRLVRSLGFFGRPLEEGTIAVGGDLDESLG
jgi:hypothetical protein